MRKRVIAGRSEVDDFGLHRRISSSLPRVIAVQYIALVVALAGAVASTTPAETALVRALQLQLREVVGLVGLAFFVLRIVVLYMVGKTARRIGYSGGSAFMLELGVLLLPLVDAVVVYRWAREVTPKEPRRGSELADELDDHRRHLLLSMVVFYIFAMGVYIRAPADWRELAPLTVGILAALGTIALLSRLAEAILVAVVARAVGRSDSEANLLAFGALLIPFVDLIIVKVLHRLSRAAAGHLRSPGNAAPNNALNPPGADAPAG